MKQELEIRQKPSSIDIEQALLSALIINRNALEKVSEFLKPEHFFDPFNAEFFNACLTLSKSNRDINPTILKEYLAKGGSDEENKEKEAKINALAFSDVSIVNVTDYGKQIVDRYIRRALIELGYDIVNDAYTIDIERDATDQAREIEEKLFKISNEGQIEGGLKSFSLSLSGAIETIAKARQNAGKLPGVPTKITKLDNLVGGLHNSDLIILAGRPGMGKTAFTTCVGINAAMAFREDNEKNTNKKDNKTVAFFSLEMSAEQLASRIISTQAQVNNRDMRTGYLKQDDFNKIMNVVEWMDNLPLYIDDTPGLTVNAIRTRCRRLKRDKGLGLIIIDYLQLIESGKKSENRVQEISEMTRNLKILAKEINVPVIVLSQLNRGVEARDDKRPQLSDLRESGSIEQDADIVMAVYREWYYLPRELVKKVGETDEKFNSRLASHEQRRAELEKIAELLILKNRHGPTDDIKLFFDGAFAQFANLDEKNEEKKQ
ncbi:MAG: Replicative DNA helicase [Alphaproteobacteria bacterium ADurb.Bin438]|nr:MAG: Replicative DNA helicase [Alphaproteobacteria bacterium ADurb.Bin438]